MKYRNFSNTGWKVSELGLGCWGLGGSWTDVTKKNALLILDNSLFDLLILNNAFEYLLKFLFIS